MTRATKGEPAREMQVIILAAGLGTRLYPLSLERPKTLLPVCNVSLLARTLAQLRAAEVRRASVVLSVVPAAIVEKAVASAPPGLDLDVVIAPPALRAQVPVMRHALDDRADSIVVIYGDSLLSLDFDALLRAHAAARADGAAATIVYHRPQDLRVPESEGRTYHGVMSVDERARVTRFVEKPRVDAIAPGFDLANAAVFVLERSFIESPEFRDAANFSYDVFGPAVASGNGRIHGHDIGPGFRYDLGSVGRLFEANRKVLRRELPGAIPGVEREEGVWVADEASRKSARILPPVVIGKGVKVEDGAQIGPDAVIGDGSRIGGGATIRNSVLFEDCRVGRRAEVDTCVLGSSVHIDEGIRLPRHSVLGAYAVTGGADWPNWASTSG